MKTLFVLAGLLGCSLTTGVAHAGDCVAPVARFQAVPAYQFVAPVQVQHVQAQPVVIQRYAVQPVVVRQQVVQKVQVQQVRVQKVVQPQKQVIRQRTVVRTR